MAKTTDTIPIWLGSKQNRKQGIVAIPAEATAEKPGLLFLEAVDGSGVLQDGLYLWARSNDTLAYHTSVPTDEDVTGTTLGTATGANLALDNLASVAINTALLDDVKNTDDIGSATKYWKDLYIGGDIYIQEVLATAFDYKLTFETPGADRVLSVPDPGAAADIMLDAGATANAISYTKGTASITLAEGNTDISVGAAGQLTVGTGTINFAGSAAFDLATAKTVNIDQDVTIQGGALVTSTAVTLDQDVQASASPTWVGLTLSGAIATPTNITMSGFLLMGDDQQIRMGAVGATDSYIEYDTATDDLIFYDRNQSGSITLSQLYAGTSLDPIVTGDLTIADGQFDWTNTAGTADVSLWTFANSTTDPIHIVADSITSGSIIKIESSIGGQAGYYIECYDGTNQDFLVADTGAITIKGTDGGTAAITLTKGDILLSDGKITAVALDSNIGSKFSRNVTGANTALLELETTHTGDTGVALLVDDKNTAGGTAIDIDSAAVTVTAGVIDVDAAVTTGHVLDINMGTAVTSGTGIKVLANSNDTGAHILLELIQDNATAAHTAKVISIDQDGRGDGIYIDKDEGGNAINIDLDNAVASQNIVALNIDVDNAGGTAGDSTGLKIGAMTSTNGTSYGLYIDDVTGGTAAYSIYTKGTGIVMFNADGDDADVIFKGDTATTLFRWDAGNDRLEFDDGTSIFRFGSGTNVFEIDAGTAQEPIRFGSAVNTDIEFHGASSGMDLQWDASDNQLNLLANAELNLDGPIVMSGIQVVLNNQVVDVVHPVTTISTAGGAQAEIMVDGQEGQMKYVLMITDGGDYVDTPTNLANGTTVTYDDVGDDAFFIFLNGEWHMLSGLATKA